MNPVHQWYCRSSHWKRKLESEILPWSVNGLDLAAEVLEVGPGPGLTTDWLRDRCREITCLEIDPDLARNLHQRAGSAKVKVCIGDATSMPFGEGQFSMVLSFTMLHHIAASALQDRLFAEAYRVLRPGGIFAGVDSNWSLWMQFFHIGDTLVTIKPSRLGGRLKAAHFEDVHVDVRGGRFRFRGRRPTARENGTLNRLLSPT